jgi:hypothetical protein
LGEIFGLRIMVAINRGRRIQSAPYNYGLRVPPPQKLFSPELTGCSTTPDNCHDADEREFGKASKIFRMLKNVSPVSGKLRTARS